MARPLKIQTQQCRHSFGNGNKKAVEPQKGFNGFFMSLVPKRGPHWV
jgi:hypothetical protein